MTTLALRLLGALAFAAAPATLVAFDVSGGARGMDALVPLVLLVLFPAAVGAVAFPWLVRVDRRILASARAGAAGFATLAVVAGVAWAAARILPGASVGSVLYAIALGLASPVGIVAASVAAAAWREAPGASGEASAQAEPGPSGA